MTTDERLAGFERHAPPGSASPGEGGVAARDGSETPERVEQDQRAAEGARRRYRSAPIQALEAVHPERVALFVDEVVVAVRDHALVERREPVTDPISGVGGRLYVTSRRILLEGRVDIAIEHGEIAETDVVGGSLILRMSGGRHVWVACPMPRLLRVEVAAARVLERREGAPSGDQDLRG